MAEIYRDMIRKAADDLARHLRENPNGFATVFALHTTAQRNGRLIVCEDAPADAWPFEVVRPRNYHRWGMVPFSAQYAVLYEACQNVPILPIHEEA